MPHTSPLKNKPNGDVDGKEKAAGVSPPELVEAVIKKGEWGGLQEGAGVA